jgi:hypothetical protein
VHRREVLQRPGRQGAVELVQRPRRGQLLVALDLRALELAAQQRLEAPQRVARDAVAARVVLGQLALGLDAQSERAADALDVDPDDARAFVPAPEGGDRQPREVAHEALRAVAQRGRDLAAQLVEVDLRPVGLRALAGAALADALADRGGLRRAEEVALEDELEDPPVLLGFCERRRERLAEVLGLGPGDLLEDGERVQQLGGAAADALGAQVLAELDEPGCEAGRDRGGGGRRGASDDSCETP